MNAIRTCRQNIFRLKDTIGSYFSNANLAFIGFVLTSVFFGSSIAWANDEDCPQARHTASAPEKFLQMKNPQASSAANLNRGKELFMDMKGSLACMNCHGSKGDGYGEMRGELASVPRNFTCKKTMQGIPDGQLFWVIQNGSPNFIMPGYSDLPANEIWQLILYIRELAK